MFLGAFGSARAGTDKIAQRARRFDAGRRHHLHHFDSSAELKCEPAFSGVEPYPWGKATGGQWRYALRNSLAMCLALWVAFVLELDEPSWALTSAAVVSSPPSAA